jgi:hypothetical protein
MFTSVRFTERRGDVPFAPLEAADYAPQQPDPAGSDTNEPSLHRRHGGSTLLGHPSTTSQHRTVTTPPTAS